MSSTSGLGISPCEVNLPSFDFFQVRGVREVVRSPEALDADFASASVPVAQYKCVIDVPLAPPKTEDGATNIGDRPCSSAVTSSPWTAMETSHAGLGRQPSLGKLRLNMSEVLSGIPELDVLSRKPLRQKQKHFFISLSRQKQPINWIVACGLHCIAHERQSLAGSYVFRTVRHHSAFS